jgi:signal transduction histidine kinase
MYVRAATGSTFRAWLFSGGLTTGLVSLVVGGLFLGGAWFLATGFARDNALRLAHQEILAMRKSATPVPVSNSSTSEQINMNALGASPARLRVVVDGAGTQHPMVPELQVWIEQRLAKARDLSLLKEQSWWLDQSGTEQQFLLQADWLLLASPIGEEHIAFVAFNLSSEKAFSNRILLLAAVFVPVIILASLLAGWFSFRRFERNLNQINHFLNDVADTRDLQRRLEVSVSPEFASLSRQINEMMARLGLAIAAVEKTTTSLAHDLRTPLAKASLMLRDLAEEEDNQNMVQVSGEIEKLAQTFETLTGIARLQLDGGARRERVRLGPLVQSSLDLFAASFEDGQIEVVSNLCENANTQTDPQLSQRVLINVLDNAAKYTGPGGKVEITLEQKGTQCQLRIVNTPAISVTKEERERLGEKFFRAEAASKSGASGYGLGLSYVRAAMQNLSGSAQWEMDDTRFQVILLWPANT